MNGDAIPLLDEGSQSCRTKGGILLLCLADKSEHFGGELVCFFRPSLLWHQCRQTSLLERSLRLIERGTREAEVGCRVAHRFSLALDAAQHLVFDLNQVSRIEKLVR